MFELLKKMKRKEWLTAGLCAILVLGQIYFDLRLPDYMSDLTVLIKTPGSAMSDIWQTGLEMLGCTLASALLAVICGYLAAQTAAGFSYTIREKVFNQVADFGQYEMQQFSVPSLINRTTNDITQIQMLVAMGLQIMIKSPIMAIWAVIKIINKSWTLSVITAGFVVALLAMMAIVIAVIVPRVRRVQKLTDNINRVSRENLTGINVVHAYNAEKYQAEKFEQANDELMRTQLFNQHGFAMLMPAVSFAMNTLALTVYWVGASIVEKVALTDVAARIATFGDIMVFGTYATYVIMSIMMMVMIVMFFPSAQVSAGRINEVLNAKITLREGKSDNAPEVGTVEFKDVSFHYPTSDKDVLENISFKVNKGETIAFIGATGSGKTTLIKLANGLLTPTSGEILIAGKAPCRATKAIVSYLPDRNTLPGWMTIAQALDYYGDFYSDFRRGVAEAMLMNLGLDRTQKIKTLSKGMREKTQLILTMSRDAKLYLLDEPIGGVDPATRDYILRTIIGNYSEDAAVIISTHLIADVEQILDEVVFLREGQVMLHESVETIRDEKGKSVDELFREVFRC